MEVTVALNCWKFRNKLSSAFSLGESYTFHCYLLRGNISSLKVFWYERKKNSQEKLISGNHDLLTLTVQGNLPEDERSHVLYYRCDVRNSDGTSSSPSAKLVILRKGKIKRKFRSFRIKVTKIEIQYMKFPSFISL